MMSREKNRILKLHRQVLLEQKANGGKGGGTNTSSSGQYEGSAFVGEGPLSTSGRQKDIGTLPDEVDITKGSKGVTFNLKNTSGQETTIPQPLYNYGNIDFTGLSMGEIITLIMEIYGLTYPEIWTIISESPNAEILSWCMRTGGCSGLTEMIFDAFGAPPSSTSPSSAEDVIDKPLSLSCCKKCDNGMYSNVCAPFDGEKECRFTSMKACQDESNSKLPSLSDIFS